jgi:3-deoxy-D-manno-octulosonic-acid transferase
MLVLYDILIRLYYLALCLASLFNLKARQMLSGRRNLFKILKSKLAPFSNIIWVHCASLGEFEQGRPLIEAIKEKYPQYKILLTFFSPSGYEIRKNYQLADAVSYIPLDTKRNARRFINIVKPVKVFFIKYEFWFHFLNRLNKENIPTYLVSANFRKDQVFFKWYGAWYRNILQFFSHIFVQNDSSLSLLNKHGITGVSVSGDTRFDRVHIISQLTKNNPTVELFKNNKPVFITGSSWPEDEKLLTRLINECNNGWKYIIAPHEISPAHIEQLQIGLTKKSIRYSQQSLKSDEYDVMIIDNIGMLSTLYQYGNIAYIGGGFGSGIHNILEAAVFGMPVLFGPNYQKFNEAKDLIEEGGAFSVSDFESLKYHVNFFITNPDQLVETSKISLGYITKNIGATKIILEKTMA